MGQKYSGDETLTPDPERKVVVVVRQVVALSAAEVQSLRDDLKAAATAKRYEREIAGTMWGTIPIATDRDSRAIYGQTQQLVDHGLRTDGAVFKFGDGVFRPLANADVLAVAASAAAYVQACFTREAALHAQIAAAADAAAVLAVDISSGWPS